MFVIDDITFVYTDHPSFTPDEYSVENENLLHVFNTLKEYCIKNGVVNGNSYIIEMPQIEIYLFDYKIPINSIEYYSSSELYIYSNPNVLPSGCVWLMGGSILYCFLGPFDGGWTFDHIPTTSVEAILFVEFAKQYGVDAIKIDGYNVIFNEGWNLLYIEPEGWITHSYTVYGANNGDLTGHIQYFEGEGSGE